MMRRNENQIRSSFKCGIFFLLFGFLVSAQEVSPAQKTSPKVGLVLSGGGAKGYAHIGVLKALEKAGLQIDYIGGASMGAIIGGLYAAGYSADQIDSLANKIDFLKILFQEKNRSFIPFFDKKYREKYIVEFAFDDFKLKLPQALSRGQGFYELLNQLFYPVRHITDYSKLPIPFLCVATNLETGEPLVIKNGNLPQDVLASAALPSMIDPVEINGQRYTDGGVSINLPVEQIKAQGIDYIIAANVTRGLQKGEEINSIEQIIMQIASYRTAKNTSEQEEKADILVKPDLRDYSVISFDDKKELIRKGEAEAMKYFEKFRQLAAKQEKPFREKPDIVLPENDSVFIENISIEGAHNYSQDYILGKMGIRPGERIPHANIAKGVDAVYATGNFFKISYDLKSTASGEALSIYLRENPSDMFLKFGVHYDDVFKTGFLVNYTIKHLFFKNSILSADFVLGDNLRGAFNYYVDNGWKPSYGYHSTFNQFTATTPPQHGEIDVKDTEMIFHYRELTQQLYVQSTLKERYALGVGFENNFLYNNNVSSKRFKWRGISLGPYAYLKIDNLDNVNFPDRGFVFDGTLKYFYINHQFSRYAADDKPSTNNQSRFMTMLNGRLETNIPLHKRITLRLRSSLGISSIKKDLFKEKGLSPEEKYLSGMKYFLGGVNKQEVFNAERFYGYSFTGLYGMNKLLWGAELQIRLLKNHYIILLSNIANLEDDIKNMNLFKYRYTGFGVSYGYDSPFGPLQLFWSYSPVNRRVFFNVALGFWF